MKLNLWKLCCYASGIFLSIAIHSLGLAQTITATGSLVTGRGGYTQTFLQNGKVLVAGGGPLYVLNSTTQKNYRLFTAELYNPATGTFSNTGNLTHDRSDHTATLLGNGLVLLVGGIDYNGESINSAELYNPSTSTFVATGNLIHSRAGHSATVLADGTVLIAGGAYYSPYVQAPSGNLVNSRTILTTAELYNPVSGTFSVTGNLQHTHLSNTATLLKNGEVLIAGGTNDDDQTLSLAEIYNPATKSFSYTGDLRHDRAGHTATLLDNGQVLIAAGINGDFDPISSAELYNPTTGAFTYTGNMQYPRSFAQAVSIGAGALTAGQVFIIGGATFDPAADPNDVMDLPELYDPSTGTFSLTAILFNFGTHKPVTHQLYDINATSIAGPRVLITSSPGNACCNTNGELYSPAMPAVRPRPGLE